MEFRSANTDCRRAHDVVFVITYRTRHTFRLSPSELRLLHVKRHFVNKNLNEVFTLTICTGLKFDILSTAQITTYFLINAHHSALPYARIQKGGGGGGGGGGGQGVRNPH